MRVAMSQIAANAALNLIIQPLWDSILVGIAQSSVINVFSVPKGQNSKTLVDTNMVQSGAIPSPNEFYLRGFMVQPLSRSPAAAAFALTDITDLTRLLDQSIFTFNVGTSGRRLVEGHAQMFPCPFGLEGSVATGGATASNVAFITGNGVRSLGNRFGLGDFAEKLNATEAFSAQFSFPAGTVTSSNSHTFRTYLTGIMGQSIG